MAHTEVIKQANALEVATAVVLVISGEGKRQRLA